MEKASSGAGKIIQLLDEKMLCWLELDKRNE